MIFFTADLHFGHENIIKHCNRPFKSAGEMGAMLIRNWNSTVAPDDEVYIILEWDCYFRGSIRLYGHIHNNRKSEVRLPEHMGLAYIVGVDLHNFHPVSLRDILRMAAGVKKRDS